MRGRDAEAEAGEHRDDQEPVQVEGRLAEEEVREAEQAGEQAELDVQVEVLTGPGPDRDHELGRGPRLKLGDRLLERGVDIVPGLVARAARGHPSRISVR